MQPGPVAKFERYSDDIRTAMRLANREAIWHFQPLIDTPHLLTAMVREPTGLAGALLRQKHITTRAMRKAVRRSVPRGRAFHLSRKLPLSANMDLVVSQAVNAAMSEKHDAVGTGGILLAMLRYDEQTKNLLGLLGLETIAFERNLSRYLHRFMVEAPGKPLSIEPADTPAA